MEKIKKIWPVGLLLLLVVLFALIVVLSEQPPSWETGSELAYDPIELDSDRFSELNTGEFATWYEKNHQQKGVHVFHTLKKTFIMVAAGEKPTGGYSVENVILLDREDHIEVVAMVITPADGEQVTEALTYPHVLVEMTHTEKRIELRSLDYEKRKPIDD